MENNTEEAIAPPDAEVEKIVDTALTFERNELSRNSFGGTEQIMERLYRDLDPELLSDFQIVPSRVRELDATKRRVLYCHDLAEDPEAKAAIELNGSWTRFHRVVFVSHWQRQQYFNLFKGLPPSPTTVIHNSIEPISFHEKPNDGTINLIYHTTPHRGLNILFAAFKELYKRRQDIHLDVYSSFEIYGWGERDKEFAELFKAIGDHPGCTYHGFKPNAEVREALKKAHIFAYPSTWMETSCIALIEAMSAGCMCVHPDLGALPETAGNLTMMYGYHEHRESHAMRFMGALDVLIEQVKDSLAAGRLNAVTQEQRNYIQKYYNWETKKLHWEAFLKSINVENREINNTYRVFKYIA